MMSQQFNYKFSAILQAFRILTWKVKALILKTCVRGQTWNETSKSELLSINSGLMAKLTCSYKLLVQITSDINYWNLAVLDQNL